MPGFDPEYVYYLQERIKILEKKMFESETPNPYRPFDPKPKKKRSLSAWQKFVKVNSKKQRYRYKSGSKKGKINLKALGVAYRKKRR